MLLCYTDTGCQYHYPMQSFVRVIVIVDSELCNIFTQHASHWTDFSMLCFTLVSWLLCLDVVTLLAVADVYSALQHVALHASFFSNSRVQSQNINGNCYPGFGILKVFIHQKHIVHAVQYPCTWHLHKLHSSWSWWKVVWNYAQVNWSEFYFTLMAH